MKLSDYDTIIFDLDSTIWTGCENEYWGKKLISPLTIKDRKIIGSDGKYVEFHENVKQVLSLLTDQNKNIGFLTLGGLLTVEYDDEPVIKCLKIYDVYKYFNHQKTVLYRTDLKSRHIQHLGKTIFIDDSEEVLRDIRNNCPTVKVLNRNEFNNWGELI